MVTIKVKRDIYNGWKWVGNLESNKENEDFKKMYAQCKAGECLKAPWKLGLNGKISKIRIYMP